MKRLVCVLITIWLSGCASWNMGNTVAGGANGEVKWCATVLDMNLICIDGKRSGPPKGKPDEG